MPVLLSQYFTFFSVPLPCPVAASKAPHKLRGPENREEAVKRRAWKALSKAEDKPGKLNKELKRYISFY